MDIDPEVTDRATTCLATVATPSPWCARVHVRLDEGQQIDPATLDGLLATPVRGLPLRTVLSDLDLWLATRLTRDGYDVEVLSAQEDAIESG